MKKIGFTLFIVSVLLMSCNSEKKSATLKEEPVYEANWDSLAKYEETAEWFKDAKFGIYAHWGVLSVPSYANDWYPRNMHIVGSNEYKYHVKTYGEPKEFGYHDFVPMFKAEKFNAEQYNSEPRFFSKNTLEFDFH